MPSTTRVPLLTIAELGEMLNVSRGQVYNLMRDAGLPYLQLRDGGDRRFDFDAVLRWLESRKAATS